MEQDTLVVPKFQGTHKAGVPSGAHPDGTDMDNYGENSKGRREVHMDMTSGSHIRGLSIDNEK